MAIPTDPTLGSLAGAPTHDVATADVEVALESLSQWQLAWRRFKRHRMALIGLGIFAFMVVVAIVGPIILPYDPLNIPGAKLPGGDAPSLAHIFGTDAQGRDVFTMVVNGARISVAIGGFSMLIAGLVGVTLGSISGYFGGWIDNVIMRVVDTFFAIPLLFVILVAARFFGDGSATSLILIFGLLAWPLIARLVRAQFLSLREADFVEAARAVGVKDPAQCHRSGDRGDDPHHGLEHRAGGVRELPQLRHQRQPDELGQRARERTGGPRAGQLVVGLLPGHGDCRDGDGDQLRR